MEADVVQSTTCTGWRILKAHTTPDLTSKHFEIKSRYHRYDQLFIDFEHIYLDNIIANVFYEKYCLLKTNFPIF